MEGREGINANTISRMYTETNVPIDYVCIDYVNNGRIRTRRCSVTNADDVELIKSLAEMTGTLLKVKIVKGKYRIVGVN